MNVTPGTLKRMRQLAQDVVDLDGGQDEAPSLADMARRAKDLLAGPLREQRATAKPRLDLVRAGPGGPPSPAEIEEAEARAWAAAKVEACVRAGAIFDPDSGEMVKPPRCELIGHDGKRCTCEGTDPDHIFGGSQRDETERHGAAAIQVLCAVHHRLKHASSPSRAFWLDIAEAHILRHGLKVMLPYLARARALLEGKRRHG